MYVFTNEIFYLKTFLSVCDFKDFWVVPQKILLAF